MSIATAPARPNQVDAVRELARNAVFTQTERDAILALAGRDGITYEEAWDLRCAVQRYITARTQLREMLGMAV